ncbi:hypothetical protein EBU02_10530 [bacterium]|nr:hypothetical protein [bacterium]
MQPFHLAGTLYHAEIHIPGLEVATTAEEFLGLCMAEFFKALGARQRGRTRCAFRDFFSSR